MLKNGVVLEWSVNIKRDEKLPVLRWKTSWPYLSYVQLYVSSVKSSNFQRKSPMARDDIYQRPRQHDLWHGTIQQFGASNWDIRL